MTSALVLGGGGITGIGWEIGLLKGLYDAGVDLTTADSVIGTSAGSVVGAQVTSAATLEELYAGQVRDPTGELKANFSLVTGLRFVALLSLPGDGRTKRRRLGRAARRTRTVPPEERVGIIRSRLVSHEWPEGDLRVTAVDAESGEFVVFDRSGPADLTHAVAASCAVPLVWPPVPIDGRLYVDGGARSAANADLAKGADRVVVIAPIARALGKAQRVEAQLERAGVTNSAVIYPDADALKAIGRNVLDPAQRPASARAGLAQAATVLDEVREVWTL